MQVYADKCFDKPLEILEVFKSSDFKAAIDRLELLSKKYYCLGYIRYGAKDVFLGKDFSSQLPLLYFEVFDKYTDYQQEEVSFLPVVCTQTIDFETYSNALKNIKRQIAQGNTYEVNYTYDFCVKTDSSPRKLYDYLLKKQKTPYNTFIQNKYETLLSFSPELFFELEDRHVVTKPMKGTIARGVTEKEDFANINFLKNDVKNRAENVMIVDLLRNDLSKIAKTGTVKVSELFGIETHKTLHQMTSTVEADLAQGVTLYDIFNAIFPCGSITGAPKISTMNIIDKEETGKRDIYCGAIGFLSPKKSVFSVPIRILQKTKDEDSYRYRAGGAIVWDSDITDEWEETLTKAKFLTDVNFQLVETLLSKNGTLLYAKEHFDRMEASAKNLGFIFNENIRALVPEKAGMVRVLLSKNGEFEVQYRDLKTSNTNKVEISALMVNSQEPLILHKTTCRPWFEEAMKKIVAGKVYDEIFLNEKGEVTEGARSNIVIEKGGKLYTPPVKCGLLNGVLRQKYINENRCEEKVLYKEDLLTADKIYCINSVRGVKEVKGVKGVVL